MSQTQRANGDCRAVPHSITLPTEWDQFRVIALDHMTGEWFKSPSGHGLYVTSVNDGWEVGLYVIETDHSVETERFESVADAASYAGKLAWETHH